MVGMTDPPADLPRRIFSRFYAAVSERMEGEGMAELRTELLADLTGEIVEIGAGNGLNFAHYPAARRHAPLPGAHDRRHPGPAHRPARR
jgi:GTPase SAR1 family protein